MTWMILRKRLVMTYDILILRVTESQKIHVCLQKSNNWKLFDAGYNMVLQNCISLINDPRDLIILLLILLASFNNYKVCT